MESILTLENIGFIYDGIPALKNISLELHPGEILGVLGPNGSGKSTLLKIIDGILVPQEGEVIIKGKSIKNLKRKDLAREMALVAQETHFRFSFTALEVVLMGRFPHIGGLKFEGKRDLEIAYNSLEATQSLELAQRPIHELSGGERQRILIARALAQEPEIVLFDEPTSFLDLKYKRQIFKLISGLSTNNGLSIVLVSHDIDLAAQYCHRILMLRNGMIHEIGKPVDVITSHNIEVVFDCPVLVDVNPASGRPRVSLKD